MLNIKNALEIRYFDAGIFVDYKNEALDFSRDSFIVALDKDTDYLYIGHYKPINSIYIDAITPNVSGGVLSGEFYNGTAFTSLENYHDESDNVSRSGFVGWSRNQTSETKTTINNKEGYWYRFSTSVTWSSTVIQAINILFSDDQALKLKFSKILETDFLDGERNFNKVHAACRDQIIETLKKRDYTKSNTDALRSSIYLESITPWDLLDIFEVKEAATYLALYWIFFDFSDSPDDIWMTKALKYEELYNENIALARLSIDENDDGLQSGEETLKESRTSYIFR